MRRHNGMLFLPTYAVSNSLTNSSHIDRDGSRSFAVFYQKQNRIGKSWFLFPNNSIAIECSNTPLVISWDGRKMKHCSCTTEPGILSFFGASSERLSQYCTASKSFGMKKSFNKRKHRDQLTKGTVVRVRKKLRLMNDTSTTKQKKNWLEKKMIRKAIVDVLNQKDGTAKISYLAKLRNVKDEVIDVKHLIAV